MWPMLAPIFPRLAIIIFRYSQVILMRYVIRYVMSPQVEQSQFDTRVLIVFASIVIYIGQAVSDFSLLTHDCFLNSD
jgi:hypothetical protein